MVVKVIPPKTQYAHLRSAEKAGRSAAVTAEISLTEQLIPVFKVAYSAAVVKRRKPVFKPVILE